MDDANICSRLRVDTELIKFFLAPSNDFISRVISWTSVSDDDAFILISVILSSNSWIVGVRCNYNRGPKKKKKKTWIAFLVSFISV